MGHIRGEVEAGQPADAFKSSTYGFVNLMWSTMPYVTAGLEYAYGMVTRQDGTKRDNHRPAIGVQLF